MPIDTSYPKERIQYMLKDSEIVLERVSFSYVGTKSENVLREAMLEINAQELEFKLQKLVPT